MCLDLSGFLGAAYQEWDAIYDFTQGDDVIALGNSAANIGLFNYQGNALIWSYNTSEWLGVLVNMDATTLTTSDFITV